MHTVIKVKGKIMGKISQPTAEIPYPARSSETSVKLCIMVADLNATV